jgi:Na+-transporting methylmalonyl-CoA/oxaloacetate decarboxylase gamma subunit
MLLGIGLFLAVVLLLLIGYIGELISSATEKEKEEVEESSVETSSE